MESLNAEQQTDLKGKYTMISDLDPKDRDDFPADSAWTKADPSMSKLKLTLKGCKEE